MYCNKKQFAKHARISDRDRLKDRKRTGREWQGAFQKAAVVQCLKAFKIKYLFQCPPSGLLIEAL